MTPVPPVPPPNPDDEDEIVAYLDGELDDDDAAKVESRIALDPAARSKAETLKKTYDLLEYLPRPEPSPTFASRTLTKIEPGERPPAGSAAAAVAVPPLSPSPSVSVAVSAAPRRGGAFVWAAAILAAAAVGIGLRLAVPTHARDDGELSLTDLRVIEKLPLYLGIDDFDFVKRLDTPELFAADPSDDEPRPSVAAEPVSPAQREALVAVFKSFPLPRRQQLRSLDQQFRDADPPTRERLGGTLERYAVWLDRLADADRREILSAPSAGERIDAVKRVRARQAREQLPAAVRAKLEQISDKLEQSQAVADYRKQELERRSAWEIARRQWAALRDGKKPWPFSEPALAKAVDDHVAAVLKPRMTIAESLVLERLKSDLPADTAADARMLNWVVYGTLVLQAAERYPTLPEYGNGTKPITRPSEIPDEITKKFGKQALTRKKLDGVPTGWPGFAEYLAREAVAQKITIPPLGPCRPGEFTPLVNEFVATFIDGTLKPDDRAALDTLKGTWPEYPKKLLDLARKYDTPVPGVTLPGAPSLWDKYYAPVRGVRKN